MRCIAFLPLLIEVMFDNIKNLLGLMEYRFWSTHLEPQTRRLAKNGVRRESTNQEATKRTLAAISNFLHIGRILLVFPQALSCKFGPRMTMRLTAGSEPHWEACRLCSLPR